MPGRPTAVPVTRRLLPPVTATTWSILGLNLVSCFGSGLTKPFLVVYLHEVRGLSLATCGLLLAGIGVAGLGTMPPAGVLIDRIGPFKSFAVGQVIGGVGTALFVSADSTATALLPCALLGVSHGITANGLSTLLAVVEPIEQRDAAYGLANTSRNVGVGIGAAAAGMVIALGSSAAYVVVFLADGASFLVFAAALLWLERTAPRRDTACRLSTVTGYRTVLADRPLLVVVVLSVLFTTAALSQHTATIPVWATGSMGVSTAVLGLAFAANSLVLVASQLVVLRLLHGRSRARMLALAGVVFAAAWLTLLLPAGHPVFLLIASMSVFALGEALLAPTLPVMVNELAPDHVRGRYNAVFNMSDQTGMILGPLLAGWLLGAGAGTVLIAGLAVVCLGVSTLSIRSGHRKPDRVQSFSQETTTRG